MTAAIRYKCGRCGATFSALNGRSGAQTHANTEHGGARLGMSVRELSEAIPPAYTEWIGRQLLEQLEAAA